MEEAAAMDDFEDATATAAVRGRGRGRGGGRGRGLGTREMLLSQAMEAGAEAWGGAEGGGGEEGLSQRRYPRSQRRTHLKWTQTCKSRGCCNAG